MPTLHDSSAARWPRGLLALVVAGLAGCASAPPAAPALSSGAVPSSAPATPSTPAVPETSSPSQAPSGSAAASPTAATPAAPPVASPPAYDPAHFARWLADFRVSAQAAGISEATLRAALDPAQELPRVIELDRAQPEFTRSVWDYLDSAVTPQRVTRGQANARRIQRELDAASQRYGVPGEIVVAIWGIESNFGGNYGSTPTIDALATLGAEGRRADWARGQLLAALRIIDQGDIDRERMVGSWAGAMGQTQFLPSNFLAYAVDADGDGRRDIWGSMADVSASTANFLSRSGWQSGQPWGVEVRLPQGFDLARVDPAVRQSAERWASEGLTSMDGRPLPRMTDAAILLPAGVRGPAFLTGPNFRTLLRYNNSTSYALAVGLLAQQVAGGPGVQAAWPRDLVSLSRSQMREMQTLLNQRGFDTGEPDGVMGPATREGLRRYQRSIGTAADGYPNAELLDRLRQP